MKWFEIKPETEGVVKLDPKTRKGELTFKVTNVSGKALRAGAVVFPQEDEQRAWTSIKGEEIQEMGEDAEKTFRVGIAAPPEAKPGEYSITFVVCNEANPEEETAEVKTEFKIDTPAEQAVNRFRQYRWHYLAAALVVGMVGLMLIVWFDYLRKAKFSADQTKGPAYLMVQFTDKSRGKPHSWLWDFGDGYTSDEQNPIHFYGLDPNDSYPKTYTVSLMIDSKEDTKTTRKEYVEVTGPKLNADFEIFQENKFGIIDANQSGIRKAIAYANKSVLFHNLSTVEPNKPEEPKKPEESSKTKELKKSPWKWVFGDSTPVLEQRNPNYTYEKEGTYEVTLDVSDGESKATGTVRILSDPQDTPETHGDPNFSYKRDSDAPEPYAVKFTQFTDKTNVALGKATSQLSTVNSGSSERAVDDNTSGKWAEGSVTHTDNKQAHPWWQVDLGKVYSEISEIEIWNRTVSNQDRLVNFYVFVSDVPFVSEDPCETRAQSGVWSQQQDAAPAPNLMLPVGRSGRYVRVQLGDKNYLSLAEVKVFAPASVPYFWEWDFGDGSTSDEQNPLHFYAEPNNFKVEMTVWGEVVDCNDKKNPSSVSKVVTVEDKKPDKQDDDKLIARFSCNRRQGKAPFKVHFADRSWGSPNSGEWNFGDGVTSTKQHPIHTYENPGTYDVTLTVRTGKKGGKVRDDIRVRDCIKVTKEAPVAEFTAKRAPFEAGTPRVPIDYARFTFEKEKNNGSNSGKEIEPVNSIGKIRTGQTVKFIDMSKGDVEKWSWDFGDGSLSEERDPNHTFNRAGTFDVSLKVVGPGGADIEQKDGYVQVCRRTKVQIIEPNEIMEPNEIPLMVCPQRLFKGSDFHGQGAEFKVSAMLKQKGARDVYAYLSMYIRMASETLGEKVPEVQDPRTYDIVAKGVVEKRIFTAPPGWMVNRIITKPTLLFWADADKADKADYDEMQISWCKFRVMGDTWGDDIGQEDETQSHMLVDIIEPIKIELIEE